MVMITRNSNYKKILVLKKLLIHDVEYPVIDTKDVQIVSGIDAKNHYFGKKISRREYFQVASWN